MLVFVAEYSRITKMLTGSHLWAHASWLDDGRASQKIRTTEPGAHFVGSWEYPPASSLASSAASHALFSAKLRHG